MQKEGGLHFLRHVLGYVTVNSEEKIPCNAQFSPTGKLYLYQTYYLLSLEHAAMIATVSFI